MNLPMLEIPCRPCDRWFLAVPNVRWVGDDQDAERVGLLAAEFVCPDCRRVYVARVNRMWEPLLRAAVGQWPDVEFEVGLLSAELAAAGDRAPALIAEGVSDV